MSHFYSTVLICGGNVVIFDRFPQPIAHFLACQKKNHFTLLLYKYSLKEGKEGRGFASDIFKRSYL